ncbi:xanthine dehydrogenase family protein subunit M [Bosea sp. BK604]|uniref:FAD binding domain-containing protein n=1 Tax=Bosea sp. BK604 TaxID=2512180 RepID=UPI00104C177A|nr:xanthine dehydrogenase family protein subunit M [Bosea sp. BK604]TCR65704.1 xanthine dehydrogenase YagS FAD-binding subunit [Bosea sp. BK604]
MNRFSYFRAESVEGALAALAADPGAKLIAGGTNLLDLMKYDVEQPSRLIDITQIEGLDTIGETTTGGIMIGALVSNTTIAYHPLISAGFPLLSSAILAGATPQLRNAATAGGNLNQRTRCYYFYDAALPCNKREPGSGCPAMEGVNRNHAILGASEQCIATHPSDMCVALAALGASVHVAGPEGQRTIAMADYHRLPNGSPERDTTLVAGEMVTGIELPAGAKRFAEHHSYLKLRDRLSYAFALVSVAASLQMDGRAIGDARLALGGVAHKPWRRTQAEEVLIGRPADDETFATAADVLLEGAHGREHNAFKIELAHRAIVRALSQAAAGTPQSQSDKRIA